VGVGSSFRELSKLVGKMSELEKHASTVEDRRTIVDFLEWLDERKYFICYYPDSGQELARPVPIPETDHQLLDVYFEIDPVQLEKERRAILEEQRKLLVEYKERKGSGR